jgi:hypothetical protein
MLYTQDDEDDIFGYTLDEANKTFTFYTPPEDGDFLYVMYYLDGGSDVASDFSGSGLMRLSKGYNVVSFMGKALSVWNSDTGEVNCTDAILANVQNLLIDQIIYTYGDAAGENAQNIIREIRTYDDDAGKYRTYKPETTDTFWADNGEHTTNTSLDRDSSDNDSGDEVSEILAADLAEGDEYTIPNSKTYQNDDKDAITVYINGQKLASDLTIGDGSVGNGDYTPYSTTTIKFNLPLETDDLVTCVITKA